MREVRRSDNGLEQGAAQLICRRKIDMEYDEKNRKAGDRVYGKGNRTDNGCGIV